MALLPEPGALQTPISPLGFAFAGDIGGALIQWGNGDPDACSTVLQFWG